MKATLFWLGFALILLAGALLVLEKEEHLRHGQDLILKLAPVDPRSLMQGDYMQLRYELGSGLPDGDKLPRDGRLILKRDPLGVGAFLRIDDGTPLSEGEIAIRYKQRNRLQIGAETFLFEEGGAGNFAAARFATLKIDRHGTVMLTALLDEQMHEISAKQQTNAQ